MGLFLITTEHLENRVWFRDDEDFKAGMNYVPVVAEATGVTILSFILMSNHVHFFIQCSGGDLAKLFIDRYKTQYSLYFFKKYKVKNLLDSNGVTIREIELSNESPECAAAYVQMNPVAANICSRPESYPWGTGNCFFNPDIRKYKRLGDYSARAQARLLHSKVELNQYFEVFEEGYINPRSYVDVQYVESLFRSPKRMNYFLMNSSKAKALREKKLTDSFSFSDQVLIMATNEMCRYQYQNKNVQDLSRNELEDLAHTLRSFFRSDANQISRILGLTYSECVDILDSFN